jgi:hypothetical protein
MNMINKTIPLLIFLSLLITSSCGFSLEFSLFADMTMTDSSQDETNNQFVLGEVDFFATEELGDNSRAFIEYVFEQTDEGLVTDLERLWISREVGDNLIVAAGRFHTPLGRWNRTYHHGAFMQETISRPFFLDFEDGAAGVLPVHIVGLMALARQPYHWGELTYEAFVANGPSINTDEFGFTASADGKPEIDINTGGDVNNDKAYGLRVAAEQHDYLSAGFFFFQSTIAESGAGVNSSVELGGDLLEQLITGLDLRLEIGEFDLLAEAYHFDNDSKVGDSKSHNAGAYFAQFGWAPTTKLKIIVRHETLDVKKDDSYFQLLGAGDEKRNLLALRYELSVSNTLKFEFNHRAPENRASENVVSLQWAFIVP